MNIPFIKNPIRKSSLVLGIIIVIETLLLISVFFINPFLYLFGERGVKPFTDFHFKDELTCTVVRSSYHTFGNGDHWFSLRVFQFRGLTSDKPEVFWKNPNLAAAAENPFNSTPEPDRWIPIKKLYDEGGYMTMGTISFGTEIIGIDKKSGSFVRTLTDENGGAWWAHIAVAQEGRCR